MIEDVGYLDALDRVEYYPWTVDAIRLLNRAGFAVVVVTNQAGIARGFFSEAFVQETHRLIDARLAAGGARVDAYYYCPHHPRGKVSEFGTVFDAIPRTDKDAITRPDPDKVFTNKYLPPKEERMVAK